MNADNCARCFMLISNYAPRVETTAGHYHRECYEAWYFGRFGRRPRLITMSPLVRYRPEEDA